MSTGAVIPAPLRIAAAVVAVESFALVVIGLVLLVKTVTGHPDNLGRALLGAAMALLGAAILGLCARGLVALRAGARSPVLVLQLIALPVGYSLAFQAGRIGYGGPILLAAAVVLYLLFTRPARAALDDAG
ncbi:MAG: hypothetical protein ABJB98_08000 [Actinomycetota bacterium]